MQINSEYVTLRVYLLFYIFMGLFDNLFLDANTPVTINDGVDHSKDIVVPIIEPVAPTLSSEWKWDDGAHPVFDIKDDVVVAKKDDSLDTLFDADTAEESAADKILSPEPPKDIALEIGLGPVPSALPDSATASTSTPDAWVSFDIGGELSFDIGWLDAPSQIGWVAESPVLEETNLDTAKETVFPDISAISPDAAIEVAPIASDVPDSSINIEWAEVENSTISTESDTSENNALFSLLNTPSTPEVVTSSEWESLVETTESVPDISSSASLLDMISPDDTPSAAVESNIVSDQETRIDAFPVISSQANEVWVINDSIWAWKNIAAPKLKEKLSEFLSELEHLEVTDDTVKIHKLEQIEMCRSRITDIKNEYDARIQALQNEMQALENEVRDMDKEKNHIKNVIQTFQKELETV